MQETTQVENEKVEAVLVINQFFLHIYIYLHIL